MRVPNVGEIWKHTTISGYSYVIITAVEQVNTDMPVHLGSNITDTVLVCYRIVASDGLVTLPWPASQNIYLFTANYGPTDLTLDDIKGLSLIVPRLQLTKPFFEE